MSYPHLDSLTRAPSNIHDSASLQFLPRQVAPSYPSYPNSGYNVIRSTQTQPLPPSSSRRYSNQSQSVHPHQRHHASMNSQRSFDRPVPQALLHDPAFSTDPRANLQYHTLSSGNSSAPPPRLVANYIPDSQVPPHDDMNNHMWQLPHGALNASLSGSRPYPVVSAPVEHAQNEYILPSRPPPRSSTVSSSRSLVVPPAPNPPFPLPEVPSASSSRSSVSASSVSASSSYVYSGMWRPPTHSMYSDSESGSGSPISLPRSIASSSASSSVSLSQPSHQSQEKNTTFASRETPSSSGQISTTKGGEIWLEPPPSYTEHDEFTNRIPPPESLPEPVETKVLVPVGPTLVPEETLTSAPLQKRQTVLVPPPVAAPFPQAQTADRPSFSTRNATAPTFRVQPPVEPPPRPATTPASAPQSSQSQPQQHHVLQRKRSRKPSTTVTPPELSRIEEADELASQDPMDPLGFAWRIPGPYEVAGPGVSRVKSKGNLKASSKEQEGENKAGVGSGGGREGPAAQAARKRAESSRKPAPNPEVNPSSFSVQPGQIFPSSISYPQPPQHYQNEPDFDPYAQFVSPQAAPSTRSQDGRSHSRHLPRNAVSNTLTPQEFPFPPQPEPSNPGTNEYFHGAPTRSTPPSHPSQLPPDRGRQYPDPTYQAQPEMRSRSRSQSRPGTQAPSERIPRPDIALPPREAAPSIRTTSTSNQRMQPRYLPKKLVMPAPLRPQAAPASAAPNDASSFTMSSLEMRSEYSRAPMNEDPLAGKKVRFHKDHGSKMGRAEAIPISQGPNVLRKRSTNFGSAAASSNGGGGGGGVPTPYDAPPASTLAPVLSRRSSMLVENVPSNNGHGPAAYSARPDAVQRAATVSGQRVPQAYMPVQVPRDFTKEKEVDRTLSLDGVSLPPLDSKEKREKKKLSKRR